MRKSALWMVAAASASAAVMTTAARSQAGVIAPRGLHATDEARLTETVQFMWGGRRYCWSNVGWRGAGWYRCGSHWRRGVGWGGPSGWNGWRPPGRPPKPSGPGFQRPVPLPAPNR